ncbi:flagellar hook-length control protein FliK [Pseudovibrio sp. JE062]|uniref:flagellar hook-length control protein FliK n=1 Tax=Pseudovibrio sp. JE062 TaxID=439495 RepID=UPI000186C164|nr:flagellar hook-length control protein FliK [Pseudovibrio sp. JE062]EEA96122.1 flagellar hook-length control protein, putative [Pseudovibrio sp. JE062]
MSQPALLSLNSPVQPQTPVGPALGQGGNALLGEGVLGQNADLFSNLLAKASEGDGAAATTVDLFSGALNAGGDLPVLNPELVQQEAGEDDVAGLAADLSVSATAQVSAASENLSVIAGVQGTGAGQTIAAGVVAPVADGTKAPFVPLPQNVTGKSSGSGEQGSGVKAVGNASAPAVDAQQVAEVVAPITRGEQIAPLANENMQDVELAAATLKERGGQILPLGSNGDVEAARSIAVKAENAGVTGQQDAASSRGAAATPQETVDSDTVKPAEVRVVQAETTINPVVLPKTDAAANVDPELVARAADAVNAGRVGGEQVQTTVATSASSQSSEAVDGKVQQQQELGRVEAPKVLGPHPSVKAEGAVTSEETVQPAAKVAADAASELAKAADVKSIKVQNEPAQTQPVFSKDNSQSAVTTDDALVESDVQDQKPVLVRRADRSGPGFVGSQQRAAQPVSQEGDGQIIFPNVTAKAEAAVKDGEQLAQVQKTAGETVQQGAESNVRVAEQSSRTASVATAAAPLTANNKVNGGSTQNVFVSEGAAETATGFEVEEQASVQGKAVEQTASTNKKTGSAPVVVQVKVQQAPEQGTAPTTFGWGLAAGPLDGSEAELNWESSEAISSTASRSENAYRSMGSLPTATLRNVANSVWPEIARQVSGGVNRFEIRLDPKELGSVDVSIEFGKDGRVRAHLIAERPETLELLQKDQRGLEKALQEAGIDADKSSLRFSLGHRDGGSQDAHQQDGRDPLVAQLDRASDDADLLDDTYLASNRVNNSSRAGGVDISV